MRVLVMVKASAESEAGIRPDPELFAAMGKFNESLAAAGVLLAADGLKPSSNGVRIRFSGQERAVIDGPFAETKELVAGFWIWKVKSLDEAIGWLKKAPFNGGEVVEIRPFFDLEDFVGVMPPEVQQRHAQLRAKMESNREA